jgi:ABC-type branched-subunit amino acid transport system substrate-binding protein
MVQIKYYDDESDAQKSAQFAERLILEEGVGLLLGPYGSAATTRVAEIAERYQANSTDLAGGVTAAKVAGAEMLLNSGHLVESLAIMKAGKELDYNPKLFAFTVGPATPNFIQTLGEDAEYVVTSSQWADTLQYRGIDIFGTSLPTTA